MPVGDNGPFSVSSFFNVSTQLPTHGSRNIHGGLRFQNGPSGSLILRSMIQYDLERIELLLDSRLNGASTVQ